MNKSLLFAILIAGFQISTFAQTERFDIMTYVPPSGWKKLEAGGSISFVKSPDARGQTGVCQIVLYPGSRSKGDAKSDFEAAWANIVKAGIGSDAAPTTTSEKRPDGWELFSGAANISRSGMTFATMVTTASGFGRTISVQVTISGIGSDCMPAVKGFMDSLSFDPKGSGATPNAAVPAQQVSFEYDYIAPAGWTARRMEGHIRLEAPGGSCLILIFPPQPSSGDLQRDASSVFDQMYPGWQPQKAGEQRYTLSKGVLPGGQEFFMTEAAMKKSSPDGARYDGFEDGAAMVVKAGAQIAIIAVRHNAGLMAHEDCYKRYDRIRRFFNSFDVRNAPASPSAEPAPSARIIGRWTMTESGASGEYIFAANGNYALIGALGSTSTSSDANYDYLHIRTYAFPGDGSYTISGNQLTLKRRGGAAEQVKIRFDQVDHGGTGWVDRIHILKRDAHGETEVAYEKRAK